MTRRIIGIALTALLAISQAAPLMAAMCGRKAMDCCDGVMCPMPKKHADTSHESMEHCAPGEADGSATTCTASPCAPKSSPAIHASTYLLGAVTQISRNPMIESACRSNLATHSTISPVPDPPPPKPIFS